MPSLGQHVAGLEIRHVGFLPEPVAGQTIEDIVMAEAAFLDQASPKGSTAILNPASTTGRQSPAASQPTLMASPGRWIRYSAPHSYAVR